MPFGGGHPYPRRHGGEDSIVDDLTQAIATDRGDAYTNDESSTVFVMNHALARTVASGWGTNERLSKLWQPMRCSPDVVKRWERILALPVNVRATWYERRLAVQERLTFYAEAVRGRILGDLQELGAVFVDIEYVTLAGANILSPDASYPFGTQLDGVPWMSTLGRAVARLQKPVGWTEGQFYEATAMVMDLMESYMPAWLDFDWYRPGPVSAVSNGFSAAGFYLDDDANLDNQIFD